MPDDIVGDAALGEIFRQSSRAAILCAAPSSPPSLVLTTRVHYHTQLHGLPGLAANSSTIQTKQVQPRVTKEPRSRYQRYTFTG